jgi:hypothetical protein
VFYPPVQVPTAQPLQALDGLNPARLVNPGPVPAGVVPAALVNPGLVPAGVVPTQLTGALTPLGLPTDAGAVTAAVNPTLSTATSTLGPLITKALNGSFGPAANEIARGMVALTAELTEASQAIASTPNGSALPVSTPPVASVPNNLPTSPAPAVPSVPLSAVADLVEDINVPQDPQPRNRPRLNVITGTGNPGESALVGNARTSTGSGGTDAPGGLRSTVQNAPKRVTDAVSGTVKSVTDTVSGAVGSLGKLGKGDG